MRNFLSVVVLLVLFCGCSSQNNISSNSTSQSVSNTQSSGMSVNEIWHRNHNILIAANEKACNINKNLRDAYAICSPLIYIQGELPDKTEDNLKRIVENVFQDMHAADSYIESFKKADPECGINIEIDRYLPMAKQNVKILVDNFYGDHDKVRFVNLCNKIKERNFMDNFSSLCNKTNPNSYPIP